MLVIDIISNVKKFNGHGQGTSTASTTTDGPSASPRGDHTTIQGDKGDYPIGGETIWANTGLTRSGRGLCNIG